MLAGILLFTFWQTTKSYSQVKSSDSKRGSQAEFSLDIQAVLPDTKIEWLSTLKSVPFNRIARVIL
jgi:hypothetical protein